MVTRKTCGFAYELETHRGKPGILRTRTKHRADSDVVDRLGGCDPHLLDCMG